MIQHSREKTPHAELDKRRFPRLSIDLDALYRIKDMKHHSYEATTVNVSFGGVCFKAEDVLPAGSIVEMKIFLAEGDCVIIVMKAVWNTCESSGIHLVGAQIIGGPEEHIERFKRFCSLHLLYPPSRY